MSPYEALLFSGILGLLIGSFLNVVIYRLPQIMKQQWLAESYAALRQPSRLRQVFSLSTPASHCPHCKTPIKPWHNIPVISYLWLGGRCAHCKQPIGLQYIAVELVTCLLSVIVTAHFGWQPTVLISALIFTWALIALSVIDLRHQLLPDCITLPLLWLGIGVNLYNTFTSLSFAVLGAIIGYLVLWVIYWLFKLITGRDALGFGDIKLLAALGAWLGWPMLPFVLITAAILGLLLAIWLKCRGKTIHQGIPFGPSLAIAGWIAMLWGPQIMLAYLQALPY